MGSPQDRLGAYLHIPFCRHKCDYCAFATWADKDDLVERYMAALLTEARRTAESLVSRGEVIDTVFVGGGTPTRVDPEALLAVIAALPLAEGAEVTVECNPDDVTAEMMVAYAAGGVNRVSIGVQSMSTHVLAALGRTHHPDNVANAVACAHAAGIDNLNLDLIYGTAGESLDDWDATVRGALALAPTHVSAYGLTVEAGTPLAARPEDHPDDDDQADKYEIVDDLATRAGLGNYEISNWARPGRECRHNMLYWHQGNYLALGCAAHGHRDGRRWWNLRTPERWVAAVEQGGCVEASHEVLDPVTRTRERLELALRMRDGVPAGALPIEGLEDLVATDGVRTWLTRRGRLLANEVSVRLVP